MVSIRLTPDELASLDALVDSGTYQSRSTALRHGLNLIVTRARNEAIVAEHRIAYSLMPDESDIGDLGLAAAVDLLGRENIEHRDAS